MTSLIHSVLFLAILHGGISGVTPAIEADYNTFKAWDSPSAVKGFDWRLAGWNYGKGFVIGAISNVLASGALAGIGLAALSLWRVR